MSQVFEGYERQYCELSANLSKKVTSASLLDGEQKKQKVSDIQGGLEDAEALIRKMDLEARSLPPSTKASLLAKLREYKTDLNNLKAEVKRITSTNVNQTSRDDLLESGMADTLMASADQRGRLMMSTERINKSSDRIRESRKTMLETEELGVSILQDLHQQRQSLLHAHSTLHGVDDNISRSKKILTNMSRRMSRNKWIIGSVITVLMKAIGVVPAFDLLVVGLYQRGNMDKMPSLGFEDTLGFDCTENSSFEFLSGGKDSGILLVLGWLSAGNEWFS